MKTKVFVLVLAFMLVVAFAFAAGGKETTDTAATAEGPQYGGTLHYSYKHGEAGSADTTTSFWPGTSYVFPVLEHLMMGDIMKGPRGTNETNFLNEYPPEERFLTGFLAESWEVSASQITFNIRKGIMWSGISPNPVMEKREYTAEDCEYFLKHYYDSAVGQMKEAGFIESIEAKDKYTCIVKTSRFSADWTSVVVTGWGAAHMPRETIEAGASDYNNLVGTGPFCIKEYKQGSYMLYEKNPHYWKKTTIDGKEYQVPFADELFIPVIVDKSTRAAAFRTGKLDVYNACDAMYSEDLDKTAAAATRVRWPAPWLFWLSMRVDQGPFKNKTVRRAAQIGTDRIAIADAQWGRKDIHQWPIAEGTAPYTPVEELPQSVAELLEYNPEKAKKMIAEVYPNGFKATVVYRGSAYSEDCTSMIKAMWEKIGIDLELHSMDYVNFSHRLGELNFEEDAVFLSGFPYQIPENIRQHYMPGGFQNVAFYDDPEFTAKFDESMETIDLDKRAAILKEIIVDALDDSAYMFIHQKYLDNYWWPWVKNYWGEASICRCHAPVDSMWLDLKQKKEMGF
jgi:peptide/nickel transport system substrate-binding protein